MSTFLISNTQKEYKLGNKLSDVVNIVFGGPSDSIPLYLGIFSISLYTSLLYIVQMMYDKLVTQMVLLFILYRDLKISLYMKKKTLHSLPRTDSSYPETFFGKTTLSLQLIQSSNKILTKNEYLFSIFKENLSTFE